MIYLDHAATTPLHPDVAAAMHEAEALWGNPSSPHMQGREARNAIDAARESIASHLGVKAQEVIFTASGSEANSLALYGTAERWQQEHGKPGHVIMLGIEHSCSLKGVERLKSFGWESTLLPVNEQGLLDPKDLKEALRSDTALVSVQWANNEIGTIQPIAECEAICTEAGILFHIDAVQPIGQLPIPTLPDMTSIAAHKFYGPKGIGALIVREHVELKPQVLGGGQEFGLRGGSENTPAIVGMAKALEIAVMKQAEEHDRLIELRDGFMEQLTSLPGVSINGDRTLRLPNNINAHFEGKSGETIVIQLDQRGICAATGSACATGSTDPSHVIQALGHDKNFASSNVRFSLGMSTTKGDLDTVFAALQEIISM